MNEIIVKINNGALKGSQELSVKGETYFSFKGIPYASPPLGKLRFKAPQPPEPWTEVRNAFKHASKCAQLTRFEKEESICGSEDCLYLNIYTPQDSLKSEVKLKPVMVWIHGGAFVAGSGDSDLFGPDYFISEDVILVTCNYRLGVFGFLRVDDPSAEIPGNAGLKDIIMVLKWVQENIKNFGGDKSNVTLFGESAGGMCVHFLMLSPLTKGLFQRAIIQSGSVLSMRSVVFPETKPLLLMAKSLNIEEKDESKILQVLQSLSTEQLLNAQLNLKHVFGDPSIFAPTVEHSSSESAVLPDHPLNIIKSGKYNHVPTIFGYNSREGMVFAMNGESFLTKDIEDYIPYHLGITKGSPKSKEIASKISQFYYNGGKPGKDNLDITYLLLSDTYYIIGIVESIKEQIRVSSDSIYLYRFSVDGKNNAAKLMLNIPFPGTCHADELGYQFKRNDLVQPSVPWSVEDMTTRRFVKLWTNFAKFGDPNQKENSDLINVNWNPVDKKNINYLEFGENLTIGRNPDVQRIKFWEEIFKFADH